MLQYSRYIFLRLLGPTFLVCFTLTGIAWLITSLQFLDFIVNRGLSISMFMYLSMLRLPFLLWVIIPISLFIGVLIAFQRMVADSEIIVLTSAGVTKFGLLKPVLLFAVLTLAASYAIALYLLPASYREFKDQQLFIRDNYASLLLQEGVFSTPVKGFTVYIRERNSDGLLKGLIVHDSRKPDISITYMAESGQLAKGANGHMLLLENGNRQEKNYKNNEFALLYFERYALDLNLFNADPIKARWREPNERFFNELFSPTDTTEQIQLNKLRAEGHQRLTWPLYNLFLCSLAVLPFLCGEHNRRGQSGRIIIASLTAVAAILWGFMAGNVVAKNPHLAVLPYIIVLCAITLVLYLVLGDPARLLNALKHNRFPRQKLAAGQEI